MKVKTSELNGLALDLAVAKCEGFTEYNPTTGKMLPPRKEYGLVELSAYNYSNDWAQAGPIIERHWIEIVPWPNESNKNERWEAIQNDLPIRVYYQGPTPLIAAMRCYVASKLGEEVEVHHAST